VGNQYPMGANSHRFIPNRASGKRPTVLFALANQRMFYMAEIHDTTSEMFEDLPSDPNLAAFELLERVKKRILHLGASSKAELPTDADYNIAVGYLEAFFELNDWKKPAGQNPGYNSTDSVHEIEKKTSAFHRHQFEAYVNNILLRLKWVIKQEAKQVLEAATATAPGYAILDSDEKKAIHKHIDKIRTIIEESGLDDRKKNSLFEQLSDLAMEVNRNGTRTDRFFAFASELWFNAGKNVKAAKPLLDEAKEILRIITRARARHDGTKLPPGDGIMSLPAPSEDGAE
jgi:hypothetical protein